MIKGRIKLYSLILIILALSAYTSWVVYNYLYQPENVTLIKASNKPYKIKPEKSETFITDNIYQSLYQKNNNANVKLSPEPEKPLKLDNDFGADIIDDIVNGMSSAHEVASKSQVSTKLVIETDSSNQPMLKKITRSSAFHLQLGAFPYENSAIDHWQKLNKDYPKIMANYTYKINVIENKSHAVHYLILEGVETINEGYSLCKKLIQNKQNCIVVK